MSLLTSNVGRKVLMAVSGLFLVLFAVAHLVGNSTIWLGSGWINAYAEHLHGLPVVVWPFRAFMLFMLCVHVFFGITLTLENWGANPGKYAVKKQQKITLASKTMIWTGLALLVFLVLHLLHFTIKALPGVVQIMDSHGRPDVYTMMVVGMYNILPAVLYVLAMAVLFLHTSHGIGSIFQTIGLNNDKTLPRFNLAATLLATVFLVGFGAIPVFIAAHFLN
ncbi:MAG: succinate dehydrogenase cytochrome b subunit [bacterium]|nr:succinate dehydrogenase cytochrome b subunit [bacterium]MDT8396187.1 succinate dehydrogenase cytochrome b subunit [bacterium]